jgi:FKBP-type peptidyl-prolyl cis-trans isomerase
MPKPYEIKEKELRITETGLKYGFVNQGEGKQAERGKDVEVHYTGFFENGEVFDSSVMRGQPISFRLGTGMVIKGWDEGIALLKEGAKAKLIIPYPLAYGEQGRPPSIPEKANLIFNVELISVK